MTTKSAKFSSSLLRKWISEYGFSEENFFSGKILISENGFSEKISKTVLFQHISKF